MSNTVTFTDATGGARFAPFSLALDSAQALSDLSDNSETTYALTFTGSGARAGHQKLKQIEAKQVLNGQPRANLAGYFDAVAMSQGELITLTFSLYDGSLEGEAVTRTVILTGVRFTASQSALGQRLDVVAFACDCLHVRAFGAVTTLTAGGQA